MKNTLFNFLCEIFELVYMYVLLITSPKHLTLRQQNQMLINPNRISNSFICQNRSNYDTISLMLCGK